LSLTIDIDDAVDELEENELKTIQLNEIGEEQKNNDIIALIRRFYIFITETMDKTNEQYLEELKKDLKEQQELLEKWVILIDKPMIENRIKNLQDLIILYSYNE